MQWLRLILCMAMLIVACFSISCSSNSSRPGHSQDNNPLTRVQTVKQGVIRTYKRNVLLGDKKAKTKAAVWARQQKGVKDAGITEDGDAIWVKFEDGSELDVIVE